MGGGDDEREVHMDLERLKLLLEPFEMGGTQVRELVVGADLFLVEGAGGLFAPLTRDRTALDLARDPRARVHAVPRTVDQGAARRSVEEVLG